MQRKYLHFAEISLQLSTGRAEQTVSMEALSSNLKGLKDLLLTTVCRISQYMLRPGVYGVHSSTDPSRFGNNGHKCFLIFLTTSKMF